MFAHRKFCRIGIMLANRFQDRFMQLTSKLIFTLSRCCANHLGQHKFVNHFHQVLHQDIARDLDQLSMKAKVDFKRVGIRQFLIVQLLEQLP